MSDRARYVFIGLLGFCEAAEKAQRRREVELEAWIARRRENGAAKHLDRALVRSQAREDHPDRIERERVARLEGERAFCCDARLGLPPETSQAARVLCVVFGAVRCER